MSTNDHFCRQRRGRRRKKEGREHDFCCPHNSIKKKRIRRRKKALVILGYYSSLCLLFLLVPMSTGTNKSYMIAVDQHQHEKSRRTLRIILIILGIIIVFAALFLAIVVYRTLKTGAIPFLSTHLLFSSKSIWTFLRSSTKEFNHF